MVEKILTSLFGSKQERDLKKLAGLMTRINSLESWAMGLPNSEMKEQTKRFQQKIRPAGADLEALRAAQDSILPEAFAVAREAARRVLGERPYDVQLLGGLVLHQGQIMEMKTGEGKTLSLVAPAYLNALAGKGLHVVTVNDYLAERDANWMGPVFRFLGLSVGAVLSSMDGPERAAAYACDLTYGTNNEFGFDFLRDHMVTSLEEKVQRPFFFCIIDEIDSVLIDEARTPLIISGSVEDDTEKISLANSLQRFLKEVKKDPISGEYPREDPFEKVALEGDFKLEPQNKRVTFTEEGMNHIESLLLEKGAIQGGIYEEGNFAYIHYFTQALRAHKLFLRDVDYLLQNGRVEIVDEFTGRVLEGRRYSDGLHQAIEAKENIKIARRNRTLATITFQKYFGMYPKLSGMTGTAITEAREFKQIYGLEVVVLPVHRPLARRDEEDLIFLSNEAKYKAIVKEVEEVHKTGQPILIGTVSVDRSEFLSKILKQNRIPHEVLNAKNHHREALIISEAGALGAVTIATNIAGRGTDIKLGGNPDMRAQRRMKTGDGEPEYFSYLAEEFPKWQKEHEEVEALGGLYVLGTERHESRRIDNQLRGRSGRQGDRGRSRFFLSLDDDLIKLFGGARLKQLMVRFGMSGDEILEHRMVTRAMERAQIRVENRNYEIRKHLLEYDEVMQRQRGLIYEMRDEFLTREDFLEELHQTATQIQEVLLDDFEQDWSNKDFAFALNRLSDRIRNNFGLRLEQIGGSLEKYSNSPEKARNLIEQTLIQYCKNNEEEKLQVAGAGIVNQILRFEYLRAVDLRWQEHLEQMEALRESVSLRAIAQKNPLVEYKNEGFALFDELLENLKIGVVRKFYRIHIDLNTDQSKRTRTLVAREKVHRQLESFGSISKQGKKPNIENVQVVRNMPKIGRNELCPCGSGKKYKNCHG